ncbi:MAG TPA: TylF/MycF/NovP-related O-methyltransferase [Chlamydiales bacterium]|nr:TylF/MycF/NovP-related O-methyltransferase [Chlamydiales bacterium]
MSYSFRVKYRNAVKSFIHRFGYDVVAFPKLEGPYEKIHVKSFYAPWKEDREFNECFPIVQVHTMVDKHRCYELWDLVEQSAKLEGALIEIGVWRGGTGAVIARKAALCKISDPVYLCDTFSGVVKASGKDASYVGGEHKDTSLEIVENLKKKLSLKNVQILRGIFPDETGHLIAHQKFRFCHVDVDVYNSAKDIVDWIWPRLVPGGIVVFDDYGLATCSGIRDYVNERKNLKDRICLHNLNGHSVWIKIA